MRFGRVPRSLPPNFPEVHTRWRRKQLTLQEAADACGLPRSTFYDRACQYERHLEADIREAIERARQHRAAADIPFPPAPPPDAAPETPSAPTDTQAAAGAALPMGALAAPSGAAALPSASVAAPAMPVPAPSAAGPAVPAPAAAGTELAPEADASAFVQLALPLPGGVPLDDDDNDSADR